MKPLIGISCNQRRWAGEYYLRTDYVRAISENYGVPVLIPVTQDSHLTALSLEHCDGLLLSGGGDLGPEFQQSRPPRFLENVDQERDWFEISLARQAVAAQKPVLAICRGLQVLNVALKGSLYQDLNTELASSGVHQADSISREASHPVYFKEGSLLRKLFGEEALVNSAHHQAIKDLGEGLVVSGESPDGIIESVEGAADHWLVGVQWHPERLLHIPPMNLLFKDFVEACRNHSMDAKGSSMAGVK